MTDPLYGPVDDAVYRDIARTGADPRDVRFLYDLTIVAVNYDEKPEQLDHLIHKWALTGPELDAARQFIEEFGQC